MLNKSEQLSLANEYTQADDTPVVCLGMTFENDEERRAYFRAELQKKLPDLRKMEGFPIGEDENIVALSDPPYYTACPNPWIDELVAEWENSKMKSSNEESIIPFVADISEGKYDLNYKLHPYHTKVPHRAIMKYILHYTNPGDIIFDGFSGTGMTGVAAQECANEDTISSLGYDKNGNEFINEVGKKVKSGARKAILNDLSPIASFLSYQHNRTVNDKYIDYMNVVNKIQSDYGWVFKTLHQDAPDLYDVKVNDVEDAISANIHLFGDINYVLWSEVFSCPSCMEEIVFWDEASNEDGSMNASFECPHCSVTLNKTKLLRLNETKIDEITNEIRTQTKIKPVKISYTYQNKRYEKRPDKLDEVIEKAVSLAKEIEGVPLYSLKKGDELNRASRSGFNYSYDYYFKKNLLILAAFKNRIEMVDAGFSLTKVALQTTKMYRYNPRGGGPLSGTMYVPSLIKDLNMVNQLYAAITQQARRNGMFHNSNFAISTFSSTNYSLLKDDSIDYIFIDPPFGANLMYSELSFLWESWLDILTNDKEEAIVNNTQNKSVNEYQYFMHKAFSELYRVLKGGKWMTVEFSNTSSSIWNAIQNAIQSAGFVIANVSILDKKKGSFKVVTSTTAVKQDLVITAYKPLKDTINLMKEERDTEKSAWTFVNQHLKILPVYQGKKGEAELIQERTPRVLFDRMVAYHVQSGLPVPISSSEFQTKLEHYFIVRDGMVFLESQVAEYDKKRILVKDFSQMNLFVSDENSAIEWIRQQLMKKPQTRQDLHPHFMKEIQHIAKHEQLPEIDDLLIQNFLRYEGDSVVPDQITSYLRRNYREFRGLDNNDEKMKAKAENYWYVPDPNKQADLEKLREKTLLREFEGYLEELATHKKKLRHFRTEAVRAGFKKAWSEKDYAKIVTVGDRLPETVIQEDDKLLMYYDNAQIRIEM